MKKNPKQFNSIKDVIARSNKILNLLFILDEETHGRIYAAIESGYNKYVSHTIDGVQLQVYVETSTKDFVARIHIRAYEYGKCIYKGRKELKNTDDLMDLLEDLSWYSRVRIGEHQIHYPRYYYKGNRPMF